MWLTKALTLVVLLSMQTNVQGMGGPAGTAVVPAQANFGAGECARGPLRNTDHPSTEVFVQCYLVRLTPVAEREMRIWWHEAGKLKVGSLGFGISDYNLEATLNYLVNSEEAAVIFRSRTVVSSGREWAVRRQLSVALTPTIEDDRHVRCHLETEEGGVEIRLPDGDSMIISAGEQEGEYLILTPMIMSEPGSDS